MGVQSPPKNNKRFLVIFLAFLAITIDGYDTFIFGALVPDILQYSSDSWEQLSPTQVGGLNSWAVFGMMFGALTVGSLTDIIGRRKVIIFATIWFSAWTFGTAYAASPVFFAATRFAAGIGLGGLMPTAIAMTVDFAPPGKRLIYNAIMFSGHPFGGVLAAVSSQLWLDDLGFRKMLELGAIAGVVLLPFLFFLLPESVGFLINRGKFDQAKGIATKFGLDYDAVIAEEQQVIVKDTEGDTKKGRSPILEFIMAVEWRAPLILFTVASFAGLMLIYGLSSWLPQLMRDAGYNLGSSLTFMLLFNIGAVIGGLVNSFMADRMGAKKPIVMSFMIAAVTMFTLPNLPHGEGTAQIWVYATYLFVAFAGFGANGTQIAIHGYAGSYFPARYRGTAMGISNTGLGRLGGVFAPLMVGVLMESSLGFNWFFYAFMVPAVMGALAILLIPARGQHGSTDTLDELMES